MENKEFIEKLKKIFADEDYLYTKTSFINYHFNVIITCLTHGDFLVEPANALYHKSGCPLCKNKKISKNRKLTKEEFIEKAKEIHGDKYDYKEVEYLDNKTKVKIICPKHGEFFQTPNNHLKGCGCKKCGYLERGL